MGHETELQLPLLLQYDVPLKNTGFSFFAKLGLYVDFSLNQYYGEEKTPDSIYNDVFTDKTYLVEFTRHMNFDINRVNFLIHSGIGISYKFRSGVGISLSGTHNIGTLLTSSIDYNIKLREINTNVLEHEFDYHVYNRNHNWNVLLGVSYTFKHKKKE